MFTVDRRWLGTPGCWADHCRGRDCAGCGTTEREVHRACEARPAHPLGLCGAHLTALHSGTTTADAA